MKTRTIILILLILSLSTWLKAQNISNGIEIKNTKVEKLHQSLLISMDIDITSLKIGTNELYLLTPAIVSQTSEEKYTLKQIQVVGRKKKIYLDRNKISNVYVETVLKKKNERQIIQISEQIPFENWMEESELMISEETCGCNFKKIASIDSHITDFYLKPFVPLLAFIQPKAEDVKIRDKSGSAFIDFVVNKVYINPNYHNNELELRNIYASIEPILNDKDVSIKLIEIHGFASPEGNFLNNKRLASQRAESLKNHIINKYALSSNLFTVTSTPEDWAGLRKFVNESSLSSKDIILSIIDSDIDPDAKEVKIKSSYTEEYSFLLQNVFPKLRHSDYKIEYEVREYVNPDEIAEMMIKEPRHLSLNELYILANIYTPGSDRFNEVFEVAVSTYPQNKDANLNAANAALMRNDLVSAEKFINKLDMTRAEELNAKASLEALNGNIEAAKSLYKQAAEKGLPQAETNLNNLNKKEQ